MVLRGVAGGYKGYQGFTGVHKGLHRVTTEN